MNLTDRLSRTIAIAETAGALALDYFRRLGSLTIEHKGHQDFVTAADRQVELLIRAALSRAFPDDGIIGEEHAPLAGRSGFTWVIDPIDGTANFVTGIPAWCVSVAGVADGKVQLGVIHDPCHGETHAAARGAGTTLNGHPQRLPRQANLGEGQVGIGYSRRVDPGVVARLGGDILAAGGVFVRNGSGALSIAYTAAGRLLGYAEPHMNGWDFLAGHLLVEEAGGIVEDIDAQAAATQGGRVIVAAPGVFDDLLRLSECAWADGGGA